MLSFIVTILPQVGSDTTLSEQDLLEESYLELINDHGDYNYDLVDDDNKIVDLHPNDKLISQDAPHSVEQRAIKTSSKYLPEEPYCIQKLGDHTTVHIMGHRKSSLCLSD